MSAQQFSSDVIKILTECKFDYELEPFTGSELFDLAKQKARLHELYLTYKEIKPADSKLKNDYHWNNLRAALEADLKANPSLADELSKSFVNYYINYGKKYVLVEQLNLQDDTKKTTEEAFASLSSDDWQIEKGMIESSTNPETSLTGLTALSYKRDSNGNHSFLLYESIGTFAYESASPTLLSDAGKVFQDQIMLKRRTVTPGIHRIIFSSDLKYRIILIDPSPLIRIDTPSERALYCLGKVNEAYKIPLMPSEFSKSVFFFTAIQKLYEDTTVGTITEGCFSTSTGSVFNNNSKGRNTDLRTDPFQKGGAIADKGNLNFTKLRVEWNHDGVPRAFLNGSSDMFFKPEKSLPFIRVTFPTNTDDLSFLNKVFEYADW